MVLVNRARCRRCGDTITSEYTHDFVWCGCGAIAVDGGHDYVRRVGDLDSVEELSVEDEYIALRDGGVITSRPEED